MLSGRVALIASAADESITRSTALTLALHGARIVWGHAPDLAQAADALVKAVRNLGREALAVPVDPRRPEDAGVLVEAGVSAFGSADILVSRVGSGWDPASAAQMAPAALDAVVQSALEGALWCIEACLPVMRRRHWGRIVAIGPFEAICWTLGSSVPAARRFLARHFERRERQHNITANLIHPGWGGVAPDRIEMALAYARHDSPWQARRHVTAQDIAEAVLYLCSEPARFMTGNQFFFALE